MRILLILLLCSFFIGCSTPPPKIVYVEVFKPISINMPERPLLKGAGNANSLDDLGKNIELDLMDLKTYSMQLEALIEEIRQTSGGESEPPIINK